MQGVLIEKPYEFVPPFKNTWMQKWLLRLNVHGRTLRKRDGVVDHEIRNIDLIRQSLKAGHGIMIIPNHPRTADPGAICHLAKETPFSMNMMASWHLFNQNWLTTTAIRAMGGFSVNREGLDRKSVDFAIGVLQDGKRPLVMFPEGTTSRTNDRLMTLMEGPAFIARTAAKRRAKNGQGAVVVHPVAIKYLFQGDLEHACHGVLTRIEHKLTWQTQDHLPLIERLIKVGNAMLTLKELQYRAPVNESLSLRQRQTNMVNHLLNPLEEEWLGDRQNGDEQSADGVQIRIKNIRMKVFPDLSRDALAPAEQKRRWRQLEDTYLAQQIDCYPEDYVIELPSVDRILETVEKFEEDLTDAARVHGGLKVILDVGEAIAVSPKRTRGVSEDPLMASIRERLNEKLSVLQHESKLYQLPR